MEGAPRDGPVFPRPFQAYTKAQQEDQDAADLMTIIAASLTGPW